MPAGYIIVQLDIHDAEAFEKYRELVPATIKQYGGEYLVRGGRHEGLEGESTPGRVVVLRFESYARALEWYNSPDYAGPKAMRLAASRGNAVVVEGVA